MTYSPGSCQALVVRTLLLGSLLLPSACRKKDEPDHVVQQRLREAAHQKRQKALREGKAHPIGDPRDQHGHGERHEGTQPGSADQHGSGKESPQPLPLEHVDAAKWPKELRALALQLVSARPHQVPSLALAVAQHGRPGYDALRMVVRQTRQPKTKRAVVSMLLAEGHMFQPDELAKMGREALLPFLQRAAIEHLAQLKDDYSQKLLQQLVASEQPMAPFIATANARPGVRFSRAQLEQLDAILNAERAEVAKQRLGAINDFELERGLFGILRTRVARPVVKGLIAKRLAMLALRGDRERLRAYAREARNPPLMRVAAAQALLASKDAADRQAIKKIMADDKDPLARALQQAAAGKLPK